MKPSPPNFNATVIFCYFVSSNLYVFVRCIVNFFAITKRLTNTCKFELVKCENKNGRTKLDGEGFTKSHTESLYSLIYAFIEIDFLLSTFIQSNVYCGTPMLQVNIEINQVNQINLNCKHSEFALFCTF